MLWWSCDVFPALSSTPFIMRVDGMGVVDGVGGVDGVGIVDGVGGVDGGVVWMVWVMWVM